MAFLKDTVVAGDLRVTDTIYGDVPLADLVDADDLKAIEALTGTSGILTKTAANTWALSSGVTPASHTHGNITNAGTIGSTANYAVYTTTNGALTAGTLATTDPTASGSGITYIASISQDSKGKISATKSTVRDASTSQSGIINTAAQSLAGVKTFNDGITVGSSKAASASDHALWTTGITIHDTRYDTIGVTSLSKSANLFFTSSGMPNSNWWSGIHMAGWYGDYNAWELIGPSNSSDQRTTPLYVRSGRTTGGWGAWRQIYDTSNKPTKADVGLGNVANTTITVTSSSVSDGTTTFNKYTHPTTSGNKHIPSGGSSGQFLGWSSDGTAKWVNNPNTNTDTLVTQTATTTDADYEVLFSATADNTTRTETARKNSNLKFNPSSGELNATSYKIASVGLISYNNSTGCIEITT